jgi:pimeloyl-ACP methyl ester carboxylesterase
MPDVSANGIELHYERRGTGTRLLFLNGSGSTLAGSQLLLDLFGGAFDLVAFDYRGLGRSAPAPRPYAMADCALDALAVMDAVGWERAAVLGLSFGGMVAQELAVTAPRRVERLALLCTSPGGAGGSSYPLHELAPRSAADRADLLPRLVDTRFTDRWLADHPADRRLLEMMADREPAGGEEPGRRLQLEARRGHDAWDRLGGIRCPTLVACGRFDGIAPPANGAALASRIAGAELRVYEGGHAFVAQDPTSLPEVIAFLNDASTSGVGPPGKRAPVRR